MISNVALQATDAAAGAAPSSGETADTGVFDALMALQSLINADAETGVNTQLAGTLEGADLLAGAEDDSGDESGDVTDMPDDQKIILKEQGSGGCAHAVKVRRFLGAVVDRFVRGANGA